MSKNTEVIDQIVSLKERIVKNEKPKNLTGFKLGDLKVEVIDEKHQKISLNGNKVQGRALVALADKLKVKPGFFDFSKKIGEKEFNEISDRLKHIEEETPIFAVVNKHEKKEENFINELYFIRPEMKHIEDSKYFDMLINTLRESDITYNLGNFTQYNDTVSLELLNPAKDLLVLPDDPWKTGSSISFNATEFNINPFFLRKICTNGMTTHQQGFRALISNKKYNEAKIQEMITEKLNAQFDLLNAQVKQQVELFNKNNVSVSEFIKVRSRMLGVLDRDQNKTLDDAVASVNKYFPDKHLYQAYACDYTKKSDQWLRTADAGVNAYDLFNKMTWIASHPKETRVNPEETGNIMIEASNLLFKETLDLSQIAPKVTFSKN